MADTNKEALASVGTRIRARRVELHYSQRDVADLSELTINTISAFENGRGGTMNNFLLICRAIQLQPGDVFNDDLDFFSIQDLSPKSKSRLEITRTLEHLIFQTEFFETPKRVYEVLDEMGLNRKNSNRFSVYLTTFCKDDVLEYRREGKIKKYQRKKRS